jgi:hypothetical protein
MPGDLATLIVTALNIINNFLGGLVNLGAPQPLTPVGLDYVNKIASSATSIAQALANIAVNNPIP